MRTIGNRVTVKSCSMVRIPPSPPEKAGNFDRIACLFFLCYDEYKDEAEGLSALLDDDW